MMRVRMTLRRATVYTASLGARCTGERTKVVGNLTHFLPVLLFHAVLRYKYSYLQTESKGKNARGALNACSPCDDV